MFCICAPNLVILAWRGEELSRGQTRDWQTDRQTDRQTDTHTDAGNDNTRRPKLASGKKWKIPEFRLWPGRPPEFNQLFLTSFPTYPEICIKILWYVFFRKVALEQINITPTPLPKKRKNFWIPGISPIIPCIMSDLPKYLHQNPFIFFL